MKSTIYVSAFGAFLIAASASHAKVYSVATNPQGSLGYRTGIAVAKVVTAKTDITARAQPMAGSTTYLPMMNRGEIDFGFTNGGELQHAADGVGTFKGRKQANLRMIGTMFPLRSGVAVVKDTGLTKISDLQKFKGKRIPSKFTSLAIVEDFMRAALANGGVKFDNFSHVPMSGLAKAALGLGSGKVDVSWVPVGSGLARKINNQLRNRGGIRYLDLDTSPAAYGRFKKIAPALTLVKVSNKKFPGIHEPTHVVEMAYVMLTHNKTTNALAHKVTKALINHQKDLGKSFGAFKRNKRDLMGSVTETAYHPGAVKAYKEAGIKVVQ
ncbi:MAG: TAXI family TRAP transporter solute-binding subunit [Pseudomonadota bacterium]|nr:TAXI family TRAP transporter solute-binding subunit [Pseudomonadota bacterium]